MEKATVAGVLSRSDPQRSDLSRAIETSRIPPLPGHLFCVSRYTDLGDFTALSCITLSLSLPQIYNVYQTSPSPANFDAKSPPPLRRIASLCRRQKAGQEPRQGHPGAAGPEKLHPVPEYDSRDPERAPGLKGGRCQSFVVRAFRTRQKGPR